MVRHRREPRVGDVEDIQDDHGMRLDALGIESVNDDIADLADAVADATP